MNVHDLLRDLPTTERRRRNSVRATVSPRSVRIAARFIDDFGLDKLIVGWIHQDNPARARGVGRPWAIEPRAYLVAALAGAISGIPGSLSHIHHVLTSDLSEESRRLMGLPVGIGYHEDKRVDAARRAIGYTAVTRMAQRIAATFDPRPYPVGQGLTQAEIDRIDAERDPADVQMRQQRADLLQSTALVGTYHVLPKRFTINYKGDQTCDGTVVPTYGKFGHHFSKRITPGARSPEANAGLHVKDRDKRDAVVLADQKAKKEYTFGYDATLTMMTGDPGTDVPPLILALSLDTPGRQPGLNAAASVRGLVDAGLPVGKFTTDLGFSQLLPENFALPMAAMGYQFMHMFKSSEHGVVQASSGGLIVVEGTVYGPCLPDVLRTCTKDFEEGRIDRTTFERRIQERKAYMARRKNGRKGNVWTFSCPGAGRGRTARCPLKEVSPAQEAAEAKGRKMLPLVVNTPANPPTCCTNSTSVSVPVEEFARYVTAIPYKTPEWDAYYRHARNQMEGKNRYLKNGLAANIASPDERRFRGWGKQFFALLIKAVAANLDLIAVWINKSENEDPPPPRSRRGRPRKPGLDKYRPQPNGPPVRTIGLPMPGTAA